MIRLGPLAPAPPTSLRMVYGGSEPGVARLFRDSNKGSLHRFSALQSDRQQRAMGHAEVRPNPSIDRNTYLSR